MIRLKIDRQQVLDEARRRACARREVRLVLERADHAGDELAACLDAARQCVQRLARPAAAIVPGPFADFAAEFGLDLPAGDGVGAEHPAAQGFAYAVTCGYDSREAMKLLQGDYVSYHLQDAMAREIAFALGREVASRLRRWRPGWQFRRCVLHDAEAASPSAEVGARRRWDPRQVARLLRRFDAHALGVLAHPSGGLDPLHSVLGLMVGTPAPPPQRNR